MSNFSDLSEYVYARDEVPRAKNVGWLGGGISFEKMDPDESVLDSVWQYCTVSINRTRGLHECELCPQRNSNDVDRNGDRLLLGSAEIRIFAANGDIFAAPNLIYHYMAVHRYRPPAEFLASLKTEPRPPSQKYFDRLASVGISWEKTLARMGERVRFRFEKTADGVKKIIL